MPISLARCWRHIAQHCYGKTTQSCHQPQTWNNPLGVTAVASHSYNLIWLAWARTKVPIPLPQMSSRTNGKWRIACCAALHFAPNSRRAPWSTSRYTLRDQHTHAKYVDFLLFRGGCILDYGVQYELLIFVFHLCQRMNSCMTDLYWSLARICYANVGNELFCGVIWRGRSGREGDLLATCDICGGYRRTIHISTHEPTLKYCCFWPR